MENLKKQIRKYPKGNLHIVHNGNYTKWFRSIGKEFIYLPKKEKVIAASLANKHYLKRELERLGLERDSARAFIKHYNAHVGKLPRSLDEDDIKGIDRRNGLYDFVTDDEYVKKWINAEYLRNMNYAEGLAFRTETGLMMRSKSEVIIDSILTRMQIPHRYECQLILGDMVFYPDFTLLHPKKRTIIYFEHFGMMDNSQYAEDAYRKLGLFNSFGIIQGINLIATFEDSHNRLDLDYVKNQLEFFFR